MTTTAATTPVDIQNRDELVFWWYITTKTPQELVTFFSAPTGSDEICNLGDEFLENIYDHKSPEFIEEYVREAIANIDRDAYLSAFTVLAYAKVVPPFASDVFEALLALPANYGSLFMLVIDEELAFDLDSINDENIAVMRERYRDIPVIDKVIARYYAEREAARAKIRARTTTNII